MLLYVFVKHQCDSHTERVFLAPPVAAQYTFFPLADHYGADLGHYSTPLATVAHNCNMNGACSAFNSEGYTKYGVTSSTIKAFYTTPCSGIYIRMGEFLLGIRLLIRSTHLCECQNVLSRDRNVYNSSRVSHKSTGHTCRNLPRFSQWLEKSVHKLRSKGPLIGRHLQGVHRRHPGQRSGASGPEIHTQAADALNNTCFLCLVPTASPVL